MPKGFEWQIDPHGVIAKLKKADGTEEVLNPEDYTCYLDYDELIIQKDGKEFAVCWCDYNDNLVRFEVEVVDVGTELPATFRVFCNKEIVKKGEDLDPSNIVVNLFYYGTEKAITVDDISRIKFSLIEEDSSYSYYKAIYEETYIYKGEELYVCVHDYFCVFYE